ncbi:MAG: methyltransferase domain-containing protein, partial [Candidatus Omnitrophota bacterium]
GGFLSYGGTIPEEARVEILNGGDVIVMAGQKRDVCLAISFGETVEMMVEERRRAVIFVALEATAATFPYVDSSDGYAASLAHALPGGAYEIYDFVNGGFFGSFNDTPQIILVWVEACDDALRWLDMINRQFIKIGSCSPGPKIASTIGSSPASREDLVINNLLEVIERFPMKNYLPVSGSNLNHSIFAAEDDGWVSIGGWSVAISHLADNPGLREIIVRKIGFLGRQLDILSVGSGLGDTEQALAKLGHNIVASDLCPELTMLMRKKGLGLSFVSDGNILAVNGGLFDMVIYLESLEFLDAEVALQEAKRVLKPRGRVIIVISKEVEAYDSDADPIYDMIRTILPKHFYSKGDIEKALENQGFIWNAYQISCEEGLGEDLADAVWFFEATSTSSPVSIQEACQRIIDLEIDASRILAPEISDIRDHQGLSLIYYLGFNIYPCSDFRELLCEVDGFIASLEGFIRFLNALRLDGQVPAEPFNAIRDKVVSLVEMFKVERRALIENMAQAHPVYPKITVLPFKGGVINHDTVVKSSSRGALIHKLFGSIFIWESQLLVFSFLIWGILVLPALKFYLASVSLISTVVFFCKFYITKMIPSEPKPGHVLVDSADSRQDISSSPVGLVVSSRPLAISRWPLAVSSPAQEASLPAERVLEEGYTGSVAGAVATSKRGERRGSSPAAGYECRLLPWFYNLRSGGKYSGLVTTYEEPSGPEEGILHITSANCTYEVFASLMVRYGCYERLLDHVNLKDRPGEFIYYFDIYHALYTRNLGRLNQLVKKFLDGPVVCAGALNAISDFEFIAKVVRHLTTVSNKKCLSHKEQDAFLEVLDDDRRVFAIALYYGKEPAREAADAVLSASQEILPASQALQWLQSQQKAGVDSLYVYDSSSKRGYPRKFDSGLRSDVVNQNLVLRRSVITGRMIVYENKESKAGSSPVKGFSAFGKSSLADEASKQGVATSKRGERRGSSPAQGAARASLPLVIDSGDVTIEHILYKNRSVPCLDTTELGPLYDICIGRHRVRFSDDGYIRITRQGQQACLSTYHNAAFGFTVSALKSRLIDKVTAFGHIDSVYHSDARPLDVPLPSLDASEDELLDAVFPKAARDLVVDEGNYVCALKTIVPEMPLYFIRNRLEGVYREAYEQSHISHDRFFIWEGDVYKFLSTFPNMLAGGVASVDLDIFCQSDMDLFIAIYKVICNARLVIFSTSPGFGVSKDKAEYLLGEFVNRLFFSVSSPAQGEARRLIKILLERRPLFNGRNFNRRDVARAAAVAARRSVEKIEWGTIKTIDGDQISKGEIRGSYRTFRKKYIECARTRAGLRSGRTGGLTDGLNKGERDSRLFRYPDGWLRVSPGASLSYPAPLVRRLNTVLLGKWAYESALGMYSSLGPWSTFLYSKEEQDFAARIQEQPSNVVIAVVRPEHIFAAAERLQALGYLAISNDFPEVVSETTPIKLLNCADENAAFQLNDYVRFRLDPTSLYHPHPSSLAHAVDIAWQRKCLLARANKAAVVISNMMGVSSHDQKIFFPTVDELQAAGVREVTFMLDGVYENPNFFPYLYAEQVKVSEVLCGEYKGPDASFGLHRLASPFFGACVRDYIKELGDAGITARVTGLGDVQFEHAFWREVRGVKLALAKEITLYKKGKISIEDVLSAYGENNSRFGEFLDYDNKVTVMVQRKEILRAFLDVMMIEDRFFACRFIAQMYKLFGVPLLESPFRESLRGICMPVLDEETTQGTSPENKLRKVLIPLFDRQGRVFAATGFFGGGAYGFGSMKDNKEIHWGNERYCFKITSSRQKKGKSYRPDTLRLLRWSDGQWVRVCGFSAVIGRSGSSNGVDPVGYHRHRLYIHSIDVSGIMDKGDGFAYAVFKKAINSFMGDYDFLYLWFNKDARKNQTVRQRKFLSYLANRLGAKDSGDTYKSEYDKRGAELMLYPLLKNQAAISYGLRVLASLGDIPAIASQISFRLGPKALCDDTNHWLKRTFEKRLRRESKEEALFINFYRSVYQLLAEILIGSPECEEAFVSAFALLSPDEKEQVVGYLKRIRDKEDYFSKSLSVKIIDRLMQVQGSESTVSSPAGLSVISDKGPVVSWLSHTPYPLPLITSMASSLDSFSSSPIGEEDIELGGLLQQLGYSQQAIPILLDKFMALFRLIDAHALKAEIPQVRQEGSSSLIAFLVRLRSSIAPYIDHSNPVRLSKLLVSSLWTGGEIFSEVSSAKVISNEWRDKILHGLVSCVAISQLTYILLHYLGIVETKGVDTEGHVFLVIPLDDDNAVFADFTLAHFFKVNIPKYYRKKDFLWFLENPHRLLYNYPFLKIINDYGLTPSIQTLIGITLSFLQRYCEAIECYKAALVLNPNCDYTYTRYGVSLFSLERFEEAVVQFRAALAINPENHKASYCLKQAILLAGKGSSPAATNYFLYNPRDDLIGKLGNDRGIRPCITTYIEQITEATLTRIQDKYRKDGLWERNGRIFVAKTLDPKVSFKTIGRSVRPVISGPRTREIFGDCERIFRRSARTYLVGELPLEVFVNMEQVIHLTQILVCRKLDIWFPSLESTNSPSKANSPAHPSSPNCRSSATSSPAEADKIRDLQAMVTHGDLAGALEGVARFRASHRDQDLSSVFSPVLKRVYVRIREFLIHGESHRRDFFRGDSYSRVNLAEAYRTSVAVGKCLPFAYLYADGL